MINVNKQMMIENFPKLKQRDHSPKRDEFIDVSLDPLYFSLDSSFKCVSSIRIMETHSQLKRCDCLS